MKILNARLPDDDLAWIMTYAAAEQRPASQIIRLAIQEYRKARSNGDRVPAVQR